MYLSFIDNERMLNYLNIKMETFKQSHLLNLPPNAIKEIRGLYNLDNPRRLKEAVDILEQWIKKQDHILKKDFKKDYLEKTIISCKGSVEKAKKQIDRLCTLKTLLPHFFTKTNVKEELKEITELTWLAPLPVMTKDYYRILITKINDKVMAEKHCLEFFQYNIMLCEYVKEHDYFTGLMTVLDFQETNILEMVMKVNPILLQHYMSILIEGFGVRFKGMFVLTQSTVVDVFIKMTKQFFSEKISNRVHVVKTLEELHMQVPRELLPIEYGGNQRSIIEIAADWVEELSTKEHVEYLKMMNKACTNEKLRRPDIFNDEYMGISGSFRNLIVD